MNRKVKQILFLILLVFGIYVAFFIIKSVKYGHSSNWQTYKEYLWLFKDSTQKDIDTSYCHSFITKSDVCNSIIYQNNYKIIIWEFKDLKDFSLSNLKINYNINLINQKINTGEVLNSKSDLEISLSFNFKFSQKISVNVDNFSKIDTVINTNNTKGFIGEIFKMSLCDDMDNDNIIYFDFKRGKTKVLVLFFIKKSSLFMILVSSKHSFNNDIMNIFNLD